MAPPMQEQLLSSWPQNQPEHCLILECRTAGFTLPTVPREVSLIRSRKGCIRAKTPEYHGPATTSHRKGMIPAYSYGVQAVEVTVDRKPGKYSLDNVTTAHESGTVINR